MARRRDAGLVSWLYVCRMTTLPPYAALLRLRIEDAGGRRLLAMPFHDDVVGRPGFLHGGAIAGLLELAAFDALRCALDDGAGHAGPARIKPVGVTVDYLRGGAASETYAHARIKRLGKRIANIEAAAWQEDENRPIATARMNMLLARD